MTVVHEPSLQLLQFAAHLPPLFSKESSRCSLLFGKATVLDFSLCESRKAVLGPWASGSPSMELTAAHRESGGTLAQGPATGPGLAPLTLPVWAVKPWFGVGFHSAQLASVYGVLLYPILDGFARHAWLGSRSTGLGGMVEEPRARFHLAKWGVFRHSARLQISPARLNQV